MPISPNTDDLALQTQSKLGDLLAAMESGTFKQVQKMLNGLQPAAIAHLLDSSPPQRRIILWRLVDKELEGEVLQELSHDVQAQILARMESSEVAAITEDLSADDVADILQHLPDQVIQEVLAAMSHQNRQRVESVLSYDEDTAGGLMDTDVITVRPDLTLDVVLRYLRRHESLPDSTYSLMVVNRRDIFLGILPLTRLLTSDPNMTVREVMDTNVVVLHPDMKDSDVASLFERNDWVMAPVIEENGRLLGRVTIDDVVDVIREDADHSLMSLAGLEDDADTFASVTRASPRRAIWLGINLLTAIIASSVINLFQDTIDKVVALAVLMPIVASMGGVAGSQTLTVVIRGMALGHIGRNNLTWLLSREFQVGAINGLLWAVVMGIIAAVWFEDITIAWIIAAAMVINLIFAALAGALLPIVLKGLRIDPALAGGVALTTVTDVVGFFAFLGLATYFYT
ncbi:magnesium transporter [Marinibactrum halimedae]|uniref:Magnesium transporter MgtE n=1 Tax=Marinibactrum halimedae TaxID=1444977 RepID=A0AA37T609_9GAMM|nr:magnesium transporter [Marinibactrum halimedae]MCD9457519.1 magnesium transporter [Marinibactrum halimedae]GLS25427.1 magnesium transporter MgtE [Marinibactrum halimedae]